jgi:tRNA (guanine37-N1)-methyltransferase
MATRMAINPLKFHLITLFPKMFSALNYGIVGRALELKIISYDFFNPRDFTTNKQKRVDDSPYGGGPGQVMQVQPLRDAINAIKKQAAAEQEKTKIIYLSPQGKLVDQSVIQSLFDYCSSEPHHSITLISGRYEGIDERVIQQDIDAEYSIGDYILSGGELPSMVLIDALTRLHPNALGDPKSAQNDSFANLKGILSCPQYTRPEIIDGQAVPKTLLSGNHEEIKQWRFKEALLQTYLKRPELLKTIKKNGLNHEEQVLLQDFIDRLAKTKGRSK